MEKWDDLSEPWKRAFLQAWEAYCQGSIPIGAVLVNNREEIILEGRNRVHEITAPEKQISNNRLAHAEMNILLQLELGDYEALGEAAIYSTMEPCIQCFGAIVLSKIRNIYFAALDDKLAGATTIEDKHGFIKSRNLSINGPFPLLGEIQMVLRTDFLLRTFDDKRRDELIAAHEIDYPLGVEIGRQLYHSNRLQKMKNIQDVFPLIFDEVASEILNHTKAQSS